MGFSESDGVCKKHPNHSQLPGVCSSCLRERLSQLSVSSSQNRTLITFSCNSSSVSSSLPYSTASSSNHVSPIRHRRHRHHLLNASQASGSISIVLSGSNGLRKSRSMAFEPRSQAGDVTEGKKKGGFFSKLLRSTGKKTKQVLMHSSTVRERF